MSSAWRQVGMNYIQYSQICAKIVRRSLKPELRTEAAKREETIIKTFIWTDGKAGKPIQPGESISQAAK